MNSTFQTIRKDALGLLYFAESGHPGGVLSCCDLVYFLWKNELDYNQCGFSFDRNRFILSKGHSVAALYAAAGRSGLLPVGSEKSLRKIGSKLQGHPHVLDLPWVETSTGSLGQGFSVGIGIALGAKHLRKEFKTYVLCGDGELQEGEIWEGAMFASHNKLDNLCVLIDYNKLQSDDLNSNIIGLEPLKSKWVSFGWNALEINGHDEIAIANAIQGFKECKDKPTVVIAHTIKGKGVSFMENIPAWHGSCRISESDFKNALMELGSDHSEIDAYLQGNFWGNLNGK